MNSNINRICILGLPRSGSQYTVELIKATIPGFVDLEEPFTLSHNLRSMYYINKKVVSLQKNLGFTDRAEQAKYVMSILRQADLDQSFIMRIFLIPEFSELSLPILEELNQMNFKFLLLKRENIEHHLLSFAFAVTSNAWNSRDKIYQAGEKILIEKFGSTKNMYELIVYFNSFIKQLPFNFDTIRYEHAVEDLEKLLGCTINTNIPIKKQITTDPYEIIENVDQVRNYVKELIKK